MKKRPIIALALAILIAEPCYASVAPLFKYDVATIAPPVRLAFLTGEFEPLHSLFAGKVELVSLDSAETIVATPTEAIRWLGWSHKMRGSNVRISLGYTAIVCTRDVINPGNPSTVKAEIVSLRMNEGKIVRIDYFSASNAWPEFNG